MKAVTLGALSFALIFFTWEAATRLQLVDPFFTSRPTAIAAALAEMSRSGQLVSTLRVSLVEFGAGYGAAVLVGLILGVLAGWFKPIGYAVSPFLWFIYSAPLIAFYPLFVLWLGLGLTTVMVIAFLLSVTPIAVNTMAGIDSVDRTLLLAARSFGARPRDLLWKVALPASVPMVVAGLRLGVGRALTGVVIAELFVPSGGLGSSISYYGALLQTTNMLASLMVIVALGVVCTQTLAVIEARLDAWRTGPDIS